MTTQQAQFIRRIQELEETSYRNNQFLFTDFLNEAEYADVLSLGEPACGMAAEGGHEGAERVIVRFGDPESFGYEEPFPITILKIEPLLEKYADALTHRDFLGALVNLGIERRVLGDILIDGVTAYLLCRDQMADYICENLTKVNHTNVRCVKAESIPDTLQPKPVSRQIQVSSVRLDAVIAHVYNLSRSQAQEIFRSQRVFVNGRLMENLTYEPKDGDMISVRHCGRFRYKGVERTTRKGKQSIRVEQFI